MWLYLLAGDVQEALVQPLFTGFFAGVLLLLYSGLRRYRSVPFSLFFTALVAVLPTLNHWSLTGSTDTAVAFYWLGSVLCLHRWLLSGCRRDLVVATLLVAFAAWTKREGLVYLAFQGGTLLIAPLLGRTVRESIRGLLLLAGMSGAILGPWLLLQGHLQVADSVFATVDVANTLARLDRAPTIVAILLGELGLIWHWGLLWILFCCALPTLCTGTERPARAYLAASVLIPLLALALGYLYSQWEPFTVHVGFSVDRLALQQAPVAVLFVALQLGNRLDRVAKGG